MARSSRRTWRRWWRGRAPSWRGWCWSASGAGRATSGTRACWQDAIRASSPPPSACTPTTVPGYRKRTGPPASAWPGIPRRWRWGRPGSTSTTTSPRARRRSPAFAVPFAWRQPPGNRWWSTCARRMRNVPGSCARRAYPPAAGSSTASPAIRPRRAPISTSGCTSPWPGSSPSGPPSPSARPCASSRATASWSRPTARTSPRSRSAGSATSPPAWSRPRARWRSSGEPVRTRSRG